MADIAQSFLQGAGLGAQMQGQAYNARLALRGQLLQERELSMREQQFMQEQDPNSLKNRYLKAQTSLMTAQADIAERTREAQIAEANAKLEDYKQLQERNRNLALIRPEYAQVFQDERTEAYSAFENNKPYIPGKHISRFLAGRGGANGIAAADRDFVAMQEQLNKEIDQQLKLNPRAFEFQAKWRMWNELKASNPEEAQKFWDANMSQSTETMEVDPATGRVVVTKGPSTALTSKVTEQAAGAINMGQLINNVLPKVNTATVGLGGALGRVIDSTLIADVFPQMFKRNRAEVFQQLGILRAEATKMLRTDTQIAEGERKAIERLLPQVSAASSSQLVQQQLMDIRSHIGRGRRTMLERTKQPIPAEFWTQEEVLAAAQRMNDAGEFADYNARMKWTNDAMFRTLYPNKFNTDLNLLKRYAPRD